MHECPHCNQKSISTLQKLIAVTPLQVTCMVCHRKSYVHIVYGLIVLTVWIVMTWILIGLAYLMQMSFLLLGSAPAMVIAVDRYLINAPLLRVNS